MSKIFFTGCGLITHSINSFIDLENRNIDEFPPSSLEHLDKFPLKNRKFKGGSLLAKEDRSLLSDNAQLALDVSAQAFGMAERNTPFSLAEKSAFPIFMVNEIAPYKFSDLERFVNLCRESDEDSVVENCWHGLGRMKEVFNPLDMLRILSTNPLYHVSKLFCLHGGGYPVRRMSLSSLCAVEDAYYRLKANEQRALVVAVGDLTVPERYAPFERMGIVKNKNNEHGILPSYGAASVIMEKCLDKKPDKKYIGELIDCCSIFKSNNHITEDDWLSLFARFGKFNLRDLTIVSYDNGNPALSENEQKAIYKYFPDSKKINYKKYVGYVGRANNLVDMVLALSDKRISSGEYILINGVGNCAGIGCILVKKI